MPDYLAKSIVAQQHKLPPFNPPPPEKYYTVTQVPVMSHPAGPMQVYALQDIGTGYLLYGTQPAITTFYPTVTERDDYSRVVGYEIGYAFGAWLNKRDAKKQIEWIDKGWFHHKTLAPGGVDMGILVFNDIQFSKPTQPNAAVDWVDEILAGKSVKIDERDRSLTLIIFVEDEQFILRFGPDVVEREFK
jgi:hypothetical protein